MITETQHRITREGYHMNKHVILKQLLGRRDDTLVLGHRAHSSETQSTGNHAIVITVHRKSYDAVDSRQALQHLRGVNSAQAEYVPVESSIALPDCALDGHCVLSR